MELNKRKRLSDCHQVMMFQSTAISTLTKRIFKEQDHIAFENSKKNQRAESIEDTNPEGT